MIKIDLVTGFLGSGKTTFIKKYAQYLIKSGYHVGIIENDYGAVNVDMLLLQDLQGDKCELEPIVAAFDETDWKRRFKAKLISLSMQGIERVIVEPSGVFDVNAFIEELYEEPLNSWYEIGSIFTIVNETYVNEDTEYTDYILLTQLAYCGCIIINLKDKGDSKVIDGIVKHIRYLLNKYNCNQTIDDKLFTKDWDKLEDSDFKKLSNSGYSNSVYNANSYVEKTYMSILITNSIINSDNVKEICRILIEDAKYGNVIRIKGFYKDKNNKWYELNASKDSYYTNRITNGQNAIIIIGNELNKPKIEEFVGVI